MRVLYTFRLSEALENHISAPAEWKVYIEHESSNTQTPIDAYSDINFTRPFMYIALRWSAVR